MVKEQSSPPDQPERRGINFMAEDDPVALAVMDTSRPRRIQFRDFILYLFGIGAELCFTPRNGECPLLFRNPQFRCIDIRDNLSEMVRKVILRVMIVVTCQS